MLKAHRLHFHITRMLLESPAALYKRSRPQDRNGRIKGVLGQLAVLSARTQLK